jgi:protein-S-isoprenylcysteine O-methyltransferase Ste14
MHRVLFFVYGGAGHLAFLGVFAYMAGFVGNILVPKSVDSGPVGPVGEALAVNLSLIALFGLQHSIMARPWFKAIWTRLVPQPIERSTYVWISNALVVLLMWQWRPMDAVVWDVQEPAVRAALWGLFAAGWLLVPLASLMINHFDLFGTRQVWLHLIGREYAPLPFRTPLLYARVRHPLYVGWMIAFWATPTMTVGHLLFAGVLTVYMLVAAVFEERDLVRAFGRQYADYQRRVWWIVPAPGGSAESDAGPTNAARADGLHDPPTESGPDGRGVPAQTV